MVAEPNQADKLPRGKMTMKISHILLQSVGVLAVLAGLVWIGQGSGYFPYPASSFMIAQTQWVWIGAGVGIVGIILILVSRRR